MAFQYRGQEEKAGADPVKQCSYIYAGLYGISGGVRGMVVSMDPVVLVNLIFCIVILALGYFISRKRDNYKIGRAHV